MAMAARLSSSRSIAAAAATATATAKFSTSLIHHHFFSSPKPIVAAAAAATTQSSVSLIHHRYPRPTAAVAKFSSSLIHHRFQSSDCWIHHRYPRPTVAVAQFSSLIRHRPPRPKPIVAAAAAAAQSSSSSLIHNTAPVGSLRSRLASNRPLHGLLMWVEVCVPAYKFHERGLFSSDYVIVELGQGPGGEISHVTDTVRILSDCGTPFIIRIPHISARWTERALELAPHGVMFAHVKSSLAAELAVSRCPGSDDTMVICQLDEAVGLDDVEAISRVEGVDCVHIGPTGLCASMTITPDPELRKKMIEAEHKLKKLLNDDDAAAAAAAEPRRRVPYMSGMVTGKDGAGEPARRGYDMVTRMID